MSPSQRIHRRPTMIGFNGFAGKILGSVAATLIAGSVIGLLILWRTSVSSAEVSKQIQVESPYVKDQAIILKAVDQEIPEIRKEIKDFRKEYRSEQIQQRVMMAELKTIMQQVQNSLDNNR